MYIHGCLSNVVRGQEYTIQAQDELLIERKIGESVTVEATVTPPVPNDQLSILFWSIRSLGRVPLNSNDTNLLQTYNPVTG